MKNRTNKLTDVNLHFIIHTFEIDILLRINKVLRPDFATEQRNIRISTTYG